MRLARRAWSFLAVYYAYMVAYRAELLLWALAMSFPFIFMGAWMEASAGGGFVMAPLEFARYFLAVFLVRQLTAVWVIWEFEYDIVHGRLSSRLLQPVDPVWRYIAGHLAERLARFPFTVLILVGFFLIFPEAWFVPTLEGTASFLALSALAFLARFWMQYTFAMLAFWTERASSIEFLWQLFYLFLSGIVAPLALFPEAVQAVLVYTPFPYLIDLPARALVGEPMDATAFLVPAGWALVAFLAQRFFWARGLRRYSSMGA